MKMYTGLCVGGPVNGRRITLRDRHQYYRVQEIPRTAPVSLQVAQPCEVQVALVDYDVFEGCGDRLFLKPTHMSHEQAMLELFNGYRPEVL